MPVSPPYSIIDTIARLRAQGGAAWGQAAQNIGQDVGAMGQNIGGAVAKKSQMDKAATAGAAQDFRAANDPTTAPVPTPQQGQSGAIGGGVAGTSATPGLDKSKLALQTPDHVGYHNATLAFDKAHDDISHIATAPSSDYKPAGDGTQGKVNMAQWMQSQGIKPAKGMENIWGTPKMTGRDESQARTTQEQMRLDTQNKIAENRDAAARAGKTMSLDAKTAAGYKMPNGEPLPAGEYPTSYLNSLNAKAGKDNATANSAASKAEILKSKEKLAGQANDLHAAMLKTTVGSKQYIAAKGKYDDFMKAHPILSGVGMGPDNPDDKTAPADTSTGPLGATTVRGGKKYTWSPETGKYHLDQGQ